MVGRSERVGICTVFGGYKSLTIYGNSVQDGIPTPNNPIEIQSVGELQEDGTYIIPIKVTKSENDNNTEIFNIILDEPLRKVGDCADKLSIDFETKTVSVERNVEKYTIKDMPFNDKSSTYLSVFKNSITYGGIISNKSDNMFFSNIYKYSTLSVWKSATEGFVGSNGYNTVCIVLPKNDIGFNDEEYAALSDDTTKKNYAREKCYSFLVNQNFYIIFSQSPTITDLSNMQDWDGLSRLDNNYSTLEVNTTIAASNIEIVK